MKTKVCQKVLAILLTAAMASTTVPYGVLAADASHDLEIAETADHENEDGTILSTSPPSENSEYAVPEKDISVNPEIETIEDIP